MPSADLLAGKRVVFTGQLEVVRAKATEAVRSLGGLVQTSVSGNTDFLVAGGGSAMTVKTHRAAHQGLTVWKGADFMTRIYYPWAKGVDVKKLPHGAAAAAPKKAAHDDDGGSDDESSSSSSSSPKPPPAKKARLAEDSPRKKTKGAAPPSTLPPPPVSFYYFKGGSKRDVAAAVGYAASLVTEEDRPARNVSLAPVDVPPPLNFAVEGGDAGSVAWTLLTALGVPERLHGHACLNPASAASTPPKVWAGLAALADGAPGGAEKNAFFFTLRKPPVSGASPCVHGTVTSKGVIVGCLTALKGA